MLRPFRLKRTIGPDYTMDLGDALNTKKVLRDLGHYRLPDYGLTPYPDERMIDGVKSFQQRNGLSEDGIMKPDGPTITALGQALEHRTPKRPSLGIAEGEWDWQRRESRRKTPFPLPPRRNLLDMVLDPHSGLKRPLSKNPIRSPLKDSVGQPLPPRPGAKPTTGKPKTETQVALAPAAAAILWPILGAVGRAALKRGSQSLLGGAATAAVGSLKGDNPNNQGAPSTKQMDPAPTVPPTPGFEPPDDKDRLPTKTESPAQPVEFPDLSQPLPKVHKPTIFIHPALPEELATAGMIIERKGNEATRKELERIRDFFLKKGWKHIAGGRYAPNDPEVLNSNKPKIKAGTEREEQHIPGPGKAFKADSRPGGHFTDLTFRDDRGRIVHIQSVDVDRNGKPTQRELNAAERIRRAEKNTDIILIPKGAQLEHNQRFRR